MMNEDKHNKKRFTVKILGQELIVTGKISKKYIDKLVGFINNIGQEINGAYPHLAQRRLFGLTAVNLADKFFKLKDRYREQLKQNKELKEENDRLKEELNSIKEEYEEIAVLLEEVDR